MSDEKEVRAKVIKNIKKKKSIGPTKKVAKELKVCCQTFSNVIKQYQENLTIDRKPGSRKKSVHMILEMLRKLKHNEKSQMCLELFSICF